jgi:hypothetical protein
VTADITGKSTQLAEIENWILARDKDRRLTAIDPDLDLIAAGLINSLSFVELTFLIGKVRGRPVGVGNLAAAQFQTLRRISESFLDGPQ